MTSAALLLHMLFIILRKSIFWEGQRDIWIDMVNIEIMLSNFEYKLAQSKEDLFVFFTLWN